MQAGADANLQNNMGDTPLHKAAYSGRKVRHEKKESPVSSYIIIIGPVALELLIYLLLSKPNFRWNHRLFSFPR